MNRSSPLWERILAATRRAAESGALQPIATDREFLEDGGIRFLVHLVRGQVRKPTAEDASRQPNPFLPYDSRLYVADIGPRHVGLLNKYTVADHHLLIITREFEPQERPLNADDFAALTECMSEFPSLGFYNSAAVAGASQPHKHLQVMALQDWSLPTAPRLNGVTTEEPQRNSADFPFLHWAARLPSDLHRHPQQFGEHLLRLYSGIQENADSLDRGGPGQQAPYNLLVTWEWLLYIPRREECFHGISLNAMAFAGALLVRDPHQLELLRAQGPWTALRHATWPEL